MVPHMEHIVITLELRRRLWTICIDGRATFTFPTFNAALESVPEAVVVLS